MADEVAVELRGRPAPAGEHRLFETVVLRCEDVAELLGQEFPLLFGLLDSCGVVGAVGGRERGLLHALTIPQAWLQVAIDDEPKLARPVVERPTAVGVEAQVGDRAVVELRGRHAALLGDRHEQTGGELLDPAALAGACEFGEFEQRRLVAHEPQKGERVGRSSGLLLNHPLADQRRQVDGPGVAAQVSQRVERPAMRRWHRRLDPEVTQSPREGVERFGLRMSFQEGDEGSRAFAGAVVEGVGDGVNLTRREGVLADADRRQSFQVEPRRDARGAVAELLVGGALELVEGWGVHRGIVDEVAASCQVGSEAQPLQRLGLG